MKNIERNSEMLCNLEAICDWENRNFNILVIDNDPSTTSLIQKILGGSDKRRVFTFADEQQAIKSFSEGHYDACIIDVTLEHSNGFVLGKILRSMAYKEFPIIYTSKEREYLVDFYKESQPNSYFYKKPIKSDVFLGVFEMMTAQKLG